MTDSAGVDWVLLIAIELSASSNADLFVAIYAFVIVVVSTERTDIRCNKTTVNSVVEQQAADEQGGL